MKNFVYMLIIIILFSIIAFLFGMYYQQVKYHFYVYEGNVQVYPKMFPAYGLPGAELSAIYEDLNRQDLKKAKERIRNYLELILKQIELRQKIEDAQGKQILQNVKNKIIRTIGDDAINNVSKQ